MSTYFTSVVVIGALVSLSLALNYKEDAVVKSALTVLLLYALSVPLIDTVQDFNPEEFTLDFNYGYEHADRLEEVSAEAYERGIKTYVADEFSLNLSDVSVKVDGYDVKTVTAERVTVILSGEARVADYRAIKAKLLKNGFGECEVKIAF